MKQALTWAYFKFVWCSPFHMNVELEVSMHHHSQVWSLESFFTSFDAFKMFYTTQAFCIQSNFNNKLSYQSFTSKVSIFHAWLLFARFNGFHFVQKKVQMNLHTSIITKVFLLVLHRAYSNSIRLFLGTLTSLLLWDWESSYVREFFFALTTRIPTGILLAVKKKNQA